eukprot:6185870-Pleurochrysis_carterae.AAC.3
MARVHGSASNHSEDARRAGALDVRHLEVDDFCILPGRCKICCCLLARLCSYCWSSAEFRFSPGSYHSIYLVGSLSKRCGRRRRLRLPCPGWRTPCDHLRQPRRRWPPPQRHPPPPQFTRSPSLAAPASRAATDAAAVDARVTVIEVVGVLVCLEAERPELQDVGLAVRLGHHEVSLAQGLVLLELVTQVLHAHELQVGVALGERQRVDADTLGSSCGGLCALL